MLGNKHKFSCIVVILLLVISLIGCNQQKASQEKIKNQNNTNERVTLGGEVVTEVTVSKIGENGDDVKEPHVVYQQNNVKELRTFANAIQTADEIQGLVFKMKPDYRLVFTFDNKTTLGYSLWLGADSGSIEVEGTDMMYRLSSNAIKDLNSYIK